MEGNRLNVFSFLDCLTDAYISIGAKFSDTIVVSVTYKIFNELCFNLTTISSKAVYVNEEGISLTYRGYKFKIKYHVPISD